MTSTPTIYVYFFSVFVVVRLLKILKQFSKTTYVWKCLLPPKKLKVVYCYFLGSGDQ